MRKPFILLLLPIVGAVSSGAIHKYVRPVTVTTCATSIQPGLSENQGQQNNQVKTRQNEQPEPQEEQPKKIIKWIDFNVSYKLLESAQRAALTSPLSTYEILAYVTLKNGNSFKNSKTDLKNLSTAVKGPTIIDRYRENKYFKHYLESYRAVLSGIINPETDETIGFHPIAKGHWYSCYDDFGNARGYGYKRRHLGHDLFGSIGTPIIAVESGTITELGWNQYGGWRIGIRSDDNLRYYYYAHLRKDKPYFKDLKKGNRVTAGQVIGYMGMTGYSRKENTNMKKTRPHLHFGMQIIFDPSQEDGPGEIWIDCHALCRFLSRNRATVQKV